MKGLKIIKIFAREFQNLVENLEQKSFRSGSFDEDLTTEKMSNSNIKPMHYRSNITSK